MNANKSTAVLIHGLHLEANGWESLVWGELANDTWGTIPRGVVYAWKQQAELVYWGSGASERDGKKEAEWMYQRAVQGADELAALCGTEPETLISFLTERSHIDTQVKDTKAEIVACYDLCLTKGISHVALIPYASQAPRAVREALHYALEDERYALLKHNLSVEPSDTRYVGVTMPDIVIFAPPHRGDRVSNPSHVYARRTLNVIQKLSKTGDGDSVGRFLGEWDAVLKKFEEE